MRHGTRIVRDMAFALLFEIFIRKSKGCDNPLIASKSDASPRDTIKWIPGDHFKVRVHLLDEPVQPQQPFVGARIDSGNQLVLNGKNPEDLTGDSYFSATGFTEVESGGEYYYEADLDLNVEAFITAAEEGNGGQANVLAELQVQDAGNTKRLSYEFPVIGKARVYQGTEGVPTSGDPVYPLPGAILRVITIDMSVGDVDYGGPLNVPANTIVRLVGEPKAYASAVLTSNGTNVANNNYVEIGGTGYTFVSALSPSEGEVLRGANADASLLNLIRAINHTGTPDEDYSCAAAHPLVSASEAVTAHSVTVTAKVGGPMENNSLTKVGSSLSWSTPTMRGGGYTGRILTVTGLNIERGGVLDIGGNGILIPVALMNDATGLSMKLANLIQRGQIICSYQPFIGPQATSNTYYSLAAWGFGIVASSAPLGATDCVIFPARIGDVTFDGVAPVGQEYEVYVLAVKSLIQGNSYTAVADSGIYLASKTYWEAQ